MKKLSFLIVIFSLLSGCSGLPVSIPFLQTPAPTQPNAPLFTATPFSLPSTNTPDLFVLNTLTPSTTPGQGTTIAPDTPIPTITSTPTSRPTITLEPIDPSLFTPSPNLFIAVQRSTGQVVWGSTCDGARNLKITAQVAPARRLKFVTLWYRLQDKYSGRHTDWGGGAILSNNKQGTYFYTLELNQIQSYRYFEDAWLQYQLVASTVTRKVLGRSVVSRTDISVTHCSALHP